VHAASCTALHAWGMCHLVSVESRANRFVLLTCISPADDRQQHKQHACDSWSLGAAAARHRAGVWGPKPAVRSECSFWCF
jgi:hypothetical protein